MERDEMRLVMVNVLLLSKCRLCEKDNQCLEFSSIYKVGQRKSSWKIKKEMLLSMRCDSE